MILTLSPEWSLRRRLADIGAGLVFGVLATTAWASLAPAVDEAPDAFRAEAAADGLLARALAIVDGDTFEARIATFPGQEIVARVRIAGVDAPERAGGCAEETAAAKAATEALAGLIGDKRLTLSAVRADKYFGRVVARVSTADGDVAQALIADGHGRAYSGGNRRGWC